MLEHFRFPDTRFLSDKEKWLQQLDALEVALEHVTQWDSAIDAGAYVGVWSSYMADHFKEVWAFEPVALNAAMFRFNMRYMRAPAAVNLVEAAISDHNGTVLMGVNDKTAAHYGRAVNMKKTTPGGFPVPCCNIDTLGLNPGLIKLDLEGHDLEGLKGARSTITRSRPVICVEVKERKDDEIQRFLSSMGYALKFSRRPDEVWAPC